MRHWESEYFFLFFFFFFFSGETFKRKKRERKIVKCVNVTRVNSSHLCQCNLLSNSIGEKLNVRLKMSSSPYSLAMGAVIFVLCVFSLSRRLQMWHERVCFFSLLFFSSSSSSFPSFTLLFSSQVTVSSFINHPSVEWIFLVCVSLSLSPSLLLCVCGLMYTRLVHIKGKSGSTKFSQLVLLLQLALATMYCVAQTKCLVCCYSKKLDFRLLHWKVSHLLVSTFCLSLFHPF